MKQSQYPLVITTEAGMFIGARAPDRQLVERTDYLLLDLAKTFICTRCGWFYPMAKAVIDSNERPVCPLCAGRWTHPEQPLESTDREEN